MVQVTTILTLTGIVVNTAWTASPSPANSWERVFNHNVVHCFKAMESGNFWE